MVVGSTVLLIVLVTNSDMTLLTCHYTLHTRTIIYIGRAHMGQLVSQSQAGTSVLDLEG